MNRSRVARLKWTLIAGLLASVVLLTSSAMAAPQLVLVNAKVFTADPALPYAQAIAIENGRILAVGPDEQVRALIGPNTRMIDAGGRLVTPGLTEAHVHLGDPLPTPPLVIPGLPFPGPGPTAEDTLAAVEQAAKTRTDWIGAYIGPLIARDRRNWRKALDAVAPNTRCSCERPGDTTASQTPRVFAGSALARMSPILSAGGGAATKTGVSTVAPTRPRRSCRAYSPRLPKVWPSRSAKHNDGTRVGVSHRYT